MTNKMLSAKYDFRIAAGVILGNTLAWGDFALYAYFSPILSRVFFPFTSASEAYVLYFIVFALAFVFRPIGSAIAGVFADRHGRKNTLIMIVVLTAILTALIGFLPSYDTIGFFSPFLLTILRILQTMSISAEPTNSGSLLIEQAPQKYKGFVTSCVMVGIFLGFLLGIFSFLLITYYFTVDQIKDWGWRIPFVSSLVIGALVTKFLLGTEESPLFLKRKAEGKLVKQPLRDSLKYQRKAIWMCFGYSLLMAVGNYFLLGFIPDFLADHVHINLMYSNLFITISVLVSVILIPLMGLLSDKIGRRPVIASGAVGFIIFSYPMLWMMNTGNLTLIAIALIIYGIVLAPTAAVLPAAIAEQVPFNVRCTASTIGYNVALTLFGGTTPIICEFLLNRTKSAESPFWYISLIALFHLMFVVFSKETKDINVNA